MKIKKALWLLFVAFCLSLPFTGQAAKAETFLFVDEAGIVEPADAEALNALANEISNEFDCVLALHIIRDGEEQELYDRAVERYTDFGYDAGILMLIECEESGYSVARTGTVSDAFTDYGVDKLVAAFADDYFEGAYLNAFTAYYNTCANLLLYYEADMVIDEGFDPIGSTERMAEAVAPEPQAALVLPGQTAGVKPPLVLDDAGLLSGEELQTLTLRAEEILAAYGCEIALVTLGDIPLGESAETVVNTYKEYNYGAGEDRSGILFVISMEDYGYSFATHGKGAAAFYDHGQGKLEDFLIDDLVNDLYYEAFTMYYDKCEEFLGYVKEAESGPALYGTARIPGQTPGVKPPLVVDDAGLLTALSLEKLIEKAEKISKAYGLDIAIVTLADMGKGDAFTNTMDLYDTYAYGVGADKSGILLMISMADRDFAFVTKGYANYAFTDYGQIKIEDAFLSALSDGSYNQAFHDYIDACEKLLRYAAEGTPVDVNSDPDEIFKQNMIKLAIALIAPVLLALIILEVWKSGMRTAVAKTTAHDYIPQNGFVLTGKEDTFLYKTESRRKIESSSSSSGRGGTSTNSRGFSGRSGKF